MRVLVTGGAGFIGSAVCRHFILDLGHDVVVVDKLTYAGNLASLAPVADNPRYAFEKHDICDVDAVNAIFAKYRPDAVVHLAAESHVDRSISGSDVFVKTNVLGTFTLLEAARRYIGRRAARAGDFRFLHVSTDEVYGSLGDDGLFTETTPYDPSSPYSATKAASDHLAKAWHRTYGLPVIVSNCSNNYGPYHFPEKLIPLMILNALDRKPLPVYGDGSNVRDWLFVEDHARALGVILAKGQPGETYNVGGRNERTNIDVVRQICLVDGSPSPRRCALPRAHFIRDRSSGARPALCDRRDQAGNRARMARARDLRDRDREDRPMVSRAQRLVEAVAGQGLQRRAAWPRESLRRGCDCMSSAGRGRLPGRCGKPQRGTTTSFSAVAQRPDVDLLRPASIAQALADFRPDIVVNPAAYTAVDKAESEPDQAFALNRDGAGAVAAAAANQGVPVIHLSTDYVFDGTKDAPYVESDPVNPQSVYGRSKLEGELAVAAANPRHIILRTSWVYAPFGTNFVRTMLRLAAERDQLRVVDDQIGCPTYAPDIAAAIIAIAKKVLREGWHAEYSPA